MKKGIDFELFTKRVYQKLERNDVLKPIVITHNKKIEGKSGCKHQIDVYWEYEKDGRKHRVAIECKNLKSRVSIGNIRDFFGVLYDLGDVQGIMVSANGFQAGTKQFAKHYGITLKELRKPSSKDTLGEIVFQFHTETSKCLFWVDEEWAAQNNMNIQRYREALAFIANKSPEEYWGGPYTALDTKDDIIRNSSHEKIASLDELKKQIPEHPEPGSSYVFKYDDAWVDTRQWEQPVKIKEVKFAYEIDDQENAITLYADEFVEGILKDAISGKIDYAPK